LWGVASEQPVLRLFNLLTTHGMQAFDYEKEKKKKSRDSRQLTTSVEDHEESIQICSPNFKREYPDDRNPLGYIVMKGKFVK